MMLPEQMMVGRSTSNTVTLNEQGALVFPAVSVALHVTIVVPTGKNDPEGGEQTDAAPGQLSFTVGGG
ncbi:hypothetical protein QNH43_08890 [Peribacillus simplex]|nr:hypothetical protein [Peribacillus simplex]WHY58360.1 hypothetical protein QNH43_08890 [Peribacillus simplex]